MHLDIYQQRQNTPITIPRVRIAFVSVINCLVLLRRLLSTCLLASNVSLLAAVASDSDNKPFCRSESSNCFISRDCLSATNNIRK